MFVRLTYFYRSRHSSWDTLGKNRHCIQRLRAFYRQKGRQLLLYLLPPRTARGWGGYFDLRAAHAQKVTRDTPQNATQKRHTTDSGTCVMWYTRSIQHLARRTPDGTEHDRDLKKTHFAICRAFPTVTTPCYQRTFQVAATCPPLTTDSTLVH